MQRWTGWGWAAGGKRFAAVGMAVAGLWVSGCSGKQVSTAASVQASGPVPALNTMTITGTVQLPAGSRYTPDQVTVINSLAVAHPDASGKFSLQSYDTTLTPAVVLSPTGSAMLTGFLDATHTTVSADTTADVLACYALGGYLMLKEQDSVALEAAVAKSAALPALSAVVASEIKANPDAFNQADPTLKQALIDYQRTTLGKSSPVLGEGGAVPLGTVITPGQQSGIDALQTGIQQAYTQNNTRRRAYAFVSKVSDTINGTVVPSAANVTDFEISPTTGVNGGVTGAVIDIFNAYYGNQTTAYGPVSSDPFGIPLTAGADKTAYKLVVVGPGGGNAALLPTLTANQSTQRIAISIKAFASDAIFPFLSNFVFGSGLTSVNPASNVTTASFKKDLLTNFLNDFIGFASSLPGLQDKIAAGQWKSALEDVLNAERQSATLRVLFAGAIARSIEKNYPGTTFAKPGLDQFMNKFNNILNAAGGLLQIFDTVLWQKDIGNADPANAWDLTVNATKVTLTPASSTINQGDTVDLTALAPGTDTTGFSYQWTLTGTAGYLNEIAGGGRTGQKAAFCSSSNKVTYVSDSTLSFTTPPTDSVKVQVYGRGSCKAADLLNEATATVTSNIVGGLQNGDFSQGLNYWTKFGNVRSINVRPGVGCPAPNANPFAELDTYYTTEGILQTFQMPASAKTVSMRVWQNLDPVQARVTLVDQQGAVHTLGQFSPPTVTRLSDPNNLYSAVCSGVSPGVYTFDVSAYAGTKVTLRLEAIWVSGYNGTIANYDDVVIK